jgi:thiosulfate reductase cytochrome b subunit
MTEKIREVSKGYLYYRHSLPVRLMHWINAVLLVILVMSGLNIFNAHPALYWGKSSYDGKPPVMVVGSRQDARGNLIGYTRLFDHEFDTTGVLGVSENSFGQTVRTGFPSWMTIPSNRWLAMARRWHFFFSWLLVINGLCFMGYILASRHLRDDLLPTGRDLRSIGKTIVDTALFRHPRGDAARYYNVLQKLAYLTVIFLLFPLAILNGLGMSPALDAILPGWVDIFGGRQSMRTIHFVIAWALVLFTIIHVFQVTVTGIWNNVRSMVTGYYKIEKGGDHV